jgi:hypothetical protein
MAVIRRVTPANPISTFPATVRPGPSIFDVLADGMAGFADHFDGLAREQARRSGAEQGRSCGRFLHAQSTRAWRRPVCRVRAPTRLRQRARRSTTRSRLIAGRERAGGERAAHQRRAWTGVDPGLISAAQHGLRATSCRRGRVIEVSRLAFRGLDEAQPQRKRHRLCVPTIRTAISFAGITRVHVQRGRNRSRHWAS